MGGHFEVRGRELIAHNSEKRPKIGIRTLGNIMIIFGLTFSRNKKRAFWLSLPSVPLNFYTCANEEVAASS